MLGLTEGEGYKWVDQVERAERESREWCGTGVRSGLGSCFMKG